MARNLKGNVMMKMSEELYGYVLKHTREPEVLAELREVTSKMRGSVMQIAPDQGQLMGFLAGLLGVKKAIEVGVYTGYSSTAVAMALPPDGKLVALDVDETTMQVARKFWEKAGVRDKVDERLGDAAVSLKAILEAEGGNSYDMAFIDADKSNYDVYYELLLQLVRPGGLILIDNVLWGGSVVNPARDDADTCAIRALNDKIFADTRVATATITIGDGLTVCRKL
ncbi:unnamed protein product [Ostreobium quekettii]|uniref:Caffeoyl-CoA O-methyltransferase n=1 Tax=Ostreobium quekettii TaxID=121088 RepID=A0A8S1IU11_9CHLO|nr:unnamed protein product [Ostreobium quekettii]